MKLARYWTRDTGEAVDADGRSIRVTCRGWSDESIEAARAAARDIARRVAAAIVGDRARSKQYLYGDRPLPEPVLREFPSAGDGPCAVVTRNAYGSVVLNTRDLMFVDIDKDDAQSGTGAKGLVSGLLSLWGKPAPAQPEGGVLTDIQRVAARNGLSGRAYKTAAGYRVLITNSAFQAGALSSESLLREFSADPLYTRLCRMQDCFRARLTPKPWRCGFVVPPVKFPFETPGEQARFQEWERKYTAATAGFATCRYLASFGNSPVAADFEDLVRYHDEETRAARNLPLG
jgi:hypothetical protein